MFGTVGAIFAVLLALERFSFGQPHSVLLFKPNVEFFRLAYKLGVWQGWLLRHGTKGASLPLLWLVVRLRLVLATTLLYDQLGKSEPKRMKAVPWLGPGPHGSGHECLPKT